MIEMGGMGRVHGEGRNDYSLPVSLSVRRGNEVRAALALMLTCCTLCFSCVSCRVMASFSFRDCSITSRMRCTTRRTCGRAEEKAQEQTNTQG